MLLSSFQSGVAFFSVTSQAILIYLWSTPYPGKKCEFAQERSLLFSNCNVWLPANFLDSNSANHSYSAKHLHTCSAEEEWTQSLCWMEMSHLLSYFTNANTCIPCGSLSTYLGSDSDPGEAVSLHWLWQSWTIYARSEFDPPLLGFCAAIHSDILSPHIYSNKASLKCSSYTNCFIK